MYWIILAICIHICVLKHTLYITYKKLFYVAVETRMMSLMLDVVLRFFLLLFYSNVFCIYSVNS